MITNFSYKAKKALRDFKCEKVRMNEEAFARMLSGRFTLELSLIDCADTAYTTGENIVINPAAFDCLFCDKRLLKETEKYMKLGIDAWSKDYFQALRLITRALNIHECLHLLYTDFPPKHIADKRFKTEVARKAFGKIFNIIEDAYVEAAGCTEFDHIDFYLRFLNTAMAIKDLNESQMISNRNIDFLDIDDLDKRDEVLNAQYLAEYTNKILMYLIYPPDIYKKIGPFDRVVEEYFNQTKDLLLKASKAPSPNERYELTWEIFKILKPIIPKTDSVYDMFCSLLPSISGESSHEENDTIASFTENVGQECIPERLLFRRGDGTPDYSYEIGFSDNVYDSVKAEENSDGSGSGYAGTLSTELTNNDVKISSISEFLMMNAVLYDSITNNEDAVEKIKYFSSDDFDCAGIHKGIKLKVRKPAINMNFKQAYNNFLKIHRQQISKYSSYLNRIIRAETQIIEEKLLFGSAITSKRLGDVKRRFWEKKISAIDIPSMSILFLVDNSGSMEGGRIQAAKDACIIMHEILKKNGISHAIVSEEAIYQEPLVEHKILVGFEDRDAAKYNILTMRPGGNTREGFSLYWCEEYMRNLHSDIKLIIVIADGWPIHEDGGRNYLPPVSTKDTKNAATKISRNGIEIVAIALKDPKETEELFNGCVNDLKNIYPSVVSCNDLNTLPGKLFDQIAFRLKRRKF